MTAIDDLYQVADGVDDVVAADHNTNVLAIQFINDAFGGNYNFGNGRNGNLKLGVISATTSTAPVALSDGSGNLTGNFYYKYTAYNLSGETAPSSASSVLSLASGSAAIQLAGTANATNITGFRLYRSIDDVTYYLVGEFPVDDPTESVTVYDNIPVTSGTAPAGSNTTAVTATAGGIYYCKDFTLSSGQTLTVENNNHLIIISNGDINISSGTIIGTGKAPIGGGFAGGATNSATSEYNGLDTSGTAYNVSGTSGKFGFAATTSAKVAYAGSRALFSAGEGGAGTGVQTQAGSSIILIAKGRVLLNSGTVTSNSATAADSASGGAGGTFLALALEYIDRSSFTLNLVGGTAAAAGGTVPAGTGGGGGIGLFVSDYIVGSATTSVAGGSGAASNGSGVGISSSGGGNGGAGGPSDSATNAGDPGSAGFVADFKLNKFTLGSI